MSERTSPLPNLFGPLLAAGLALGVSISFNNGAYDDKAILLLVGGFLLLAWCWLEGFGKTFERPATLERSLAPAVLIGLLVSAFWGWADLGLIMYAQRAWVTGRNCMVLTGLLLLTYLPSMLISARSAWREPQALKVARFVLFGILITVAGVDALQASPKPVIDVWTVQQQGADALLHGHNPYTHVAAIDTTPGRSGNDTPYVYPPTQVLVGILGYVPFKDVRYSMLAAILLAGICMRLLTERAAKADKDLSPLLLDAPTLFLWCTPKLYFILEQSWVDPIQLGFISVAVTAFVYEKRLAAAILFGVAGSSKQTLFWIVPIAGFGLRFTKKEWAAMLVAGALPVLPFLAWDFKALKHSNFDFLKNIPSRPDALTLGNFINRRFQTAYEGYGSFPLTAAVVALASWRMRGIARVTCAIAFAFVMFFAFNKQAFANYYFFVTGLASLAAAAALAANVAKVSEVVASTGPSADPEPASTTAESP